MAPARRGAESETRTRSALHSSHLDSVRPCTALDRRIETFTRGGGPLGYELMRFAACARVEKVGEEEQVAPALAILHVLSLQGSRTTFWNDYSTKRPSRRRDREARLMISALRRTTRRNVARSLLSSLVSAAFTLDRRSHTLVVRQSRTQRCLPRAEGASSRGPCALTLTATR